MSYMIPYHYKRSYYRNKRSADLTEHDVLHYVVPIAGEDLHLELSPNVEMVSPSMVVERFRERGSSGPRIRPSDDVQCHYRGAVRGDGSSKVALSTCYGLVGSANVHLAGCNIRVLPKTGYIRSKRGYFFIEPSADHYPLSGEEHPHLVYERESDVSDAGANCYVAGNVARAIAKRAANEYGEQKKGDNLTNAQLYIETLVVLDHSLLEYHKSIDIENYVLTVFNMVSLASQGSKNTHLANINIRVMEQTCKKSKKYSRYITDFKNKIQLSIICHKDDISDKGI